MSEEDRLVYGIVVEYEKEGDNDDDDNYIFSKTKQPEITYLTYFTDKSSYTIENEGKKSIHFAGSDGKDHMKSFKEKNNKIVYRLVYTGIQTNGTHTLLNIFKFNHDKQNFIPIKLPNRRFPNENKKEENNNLRGVMKSTAKTINEVIHNISDKEPAKPVSFPTSPVTTKDSNEISIPILNVKKSIENMISELSIAEITKILNHGKDFLSKLSLGSKFEEKEEKKEKEKDEDEDEDEEEEAEEEEKQNLSPIVSNLSESIKTLLEKLAKASEEAEAKAEEKSKAEEKENLQGIVENIKKVIDETIIKIPDSKDKDDRPNDKTEEILKKEQENISTLLSNISSPINEILKKLAEAPTPTPAPAPTPAPVPVEEKQNLQEIMGNIGKTTGDIVSKIPDSDETDLDGVILDMDDESANIKPIIDSIVSALNSTIEEIHEYNQEYENILKTIRKSTNTDSIHLSFFILKALLRYIRKKKEKKEENGKGTEEEDEDIKKLESIIKTKLANAVKKEKKDQDQDDLNLITNDLANKLNQIISKIEDKELWNELGKKEELDELEKQKELEELEELEKLEKQNDQDNLKNITTDLISNVNQIMLKIQNVESLNKLKKQRELGKQKELEKQRELEKEKELEEQKELEELEKEKDFIKSIIQSIRDHTNTVISKIGTTEIRKELATSTINNITNKQIETATKRKKDRKEEEEEEEEEEDDEEEKKRQEDDEEEEEESENEFSIPNNLNKLPIVASKTDEKNSITSIMDEIQEQINNILDNINNSERQRKEQEEDKDKDKDDDEKEEEDDDELIVNLDINPIEKKDKRGKVQYIKTFYDTFLDSLKKQEKIKEIQKDHQPVDNVDAYPRGYTNQLFADRHKIPDTYFRKYLKNEIKKGDNVLNPNDIIGDILTGGGLFNGKDRKGLQDTNILDFTIEKLEKEIEEYLQTTHILFKDPGKYENIQKIYMYVESFAIYFYNKYYKPEQHLKFDKTNENTNPVLYSIHHDLLQAQDETTTKIDTAKKLAITYPDILINNKQKLKFPPKMLTAVFDILYPKEKKGVKTDVTTIESNPLKSILIGSLLTMSSRRTMSSRSKKRDTLTLNSLNEFVLKCDKGASSSGNHTPRQKKGDGKIGLEEFKKGVLMQLNMELDEEMKNKITDLFTEIKHNESIDQIEQDDFKKFFVNTARTMHIKLDQKIINQYQDGLKVVNKSVDQPIVTVLNNVFGELLVTDRNIYIFNYDDHYIETDQDEHFNREIYTPIETSRPRTAPQNQGKKGLTVIDVKPTAVDATVHTRDYNPRQKNVRGEFKSARLKGTSDPKTVSMNNNQSLPGIKAMMKQVAINEGKRSNPRPSGAQGSIRRTGLP